jgi:hypothetical protein
MIISYFAFCRSRFGKALGKGPTPLTAILGCPSRIKRIPELLYSKDMYEFSF